MSSAETEAIGAQGYAVRHGVLDEQTLARLLAAIGEIGDFAGASDGRRRAGGVRNLLSLVPAVRELADSAEMRELVEPYVGPRAFAVRGILFDKVPGANWVVPWHQDLSIAVKEKREVPGFGPWSVKAGVPHVQPPMEVLAGMLTARIHLDDCGEENGPLKVIPGSHARALSPGEIDLARECGPIVSCPLPAGGVLLMRPMLLHASSPALRPGHRRVIHIEYAAEQLPSGLEWFEA